jgi:hypothetical protein
MLVAAKLTKACSLAMSASERLLKHVGWRGAPHAVNLHFDGTVYRAV